MQASLRPLADCLLRCCREVYGGRLVTLAVFGSWARGVATPESDLDLLIVATDLPSGRMARVREFDAVDEATAHVRGSIWTSEYRPVELSPVFKTPTEVEHGSPLFLDMTEHRVVLADRDSFFETWLQGLRRRMARNGTRRVEAKGGYYWLYKPDARPGEAIEL